MDYPILLINPTGLDEFHTPDLELQFIEELIPKTPAFEHIIQCFVKSKSATEFHKFTLKAENTDSIL